jgi:hypothetical protein
MPVSIAKRLNINLKKLLHGNSLQHPGGNHMVIVRSPQTYV